jgi:type 1 glutamine amidotransferase
MLADFKGTTFEINEEIYRIKPVKLRQNCRVLMSLDMTNATNLGASGVRQTDKDVPISWVRSFGKGRVFYCSFGQNNHIFWNPVILQHYLDGIQFALGDLPADTTPLSPSATDTAKAATQR